MSSVERQCNADCIPEVWPYSTAHNKPAESLPVGEPNGRPLNSGLSEVVRDSVPHRLRNGLDAHTSIFSPPSIATVSSPVGTVLMTTLDRDDGRRMAIPLVWAKSEALVGQPGLPILSAFPIKMGTNQFPNAENFVNNFFGSGF